MVTKMVFFFAALLYATLAKAEDIVIKTQTGKVRGDRYVTTNDFIYFGFRGIPYAQKPVDSLRFEPPEPAESWTDTLDATSDQKSCISGQYFENQNSESEDCLYINVYTPMYEGVTRLLPVMVWIYGGGFVQGNSTKDLYGPDFLIEQEVVLVTFNYRLGPFGFLSTRDTILPGNQGMKDQLLALKWVRDNIRSFGGNPAEVTIFGESAGGVSVGLHLVSPQSNGLFRAAIAQSGSALNSFGIVEDPATTAFRLGDLIPSEVNIDHDSSLLKAFLKKCSVAEIANATLYLSQGAHFAPVIEQSSKSDAFLTENPYVLLESGRFNQVPLVIGITAEESLYFLKDVDTAETRAIAADILPTNLIPSDLHCNTSVEDEVENAIRNIYLEKGDVFRRNLPAFARYTSDNMFTRGIIKQAELTAARNVAVYFYQFSYFGRPKYVPFLDGAEKATHGAEVPFLFNVKSISGTTDAGDLAIQDEIVKLWTRFAKTLQPRPDIEYDVWPQYNGITGVYLNINSTFEVRTDLKSESYPAWNDIFETYGRKPFVTY